MTEQVMLYAGLRVPLDNIEKEYNDVKDRIIAAYRKMREDPSFPEFGGWANTIVSSDSAEKVRTYLRAFGAEIPGVALYVRASHQRAEYLYLVDGSNLSIIEKVQTHTEYVQGVSKNTTGYSFERGEKIRKFLMKLDIDGLLSPSDVGDDNGSTPCTKLLFEPITECWDVCGGLIPPGEECPCCGSK